MERQSKIGRSIVLLLFWATTINYIDRQVIGLLKPSIERTLHWSETDYGYIVTAFQIAYAAGLLLSGRLLDKFGTRFGYTIAIAVWSAGAFLHAFTQSVMGFGIARAILGLGEAANFPAAIKTVAEWFPKRDRALATGVFNSGSNIGAILAPLIVVSITVSLGWKWAFVLTGALGFVWIIFWLIFYKEPQKHRGVKQPELDYILSDHDSDVSGGVRWGTLLKYRVTYVICLCRFLTDWVWWFFLFWAPDFLSKTERVDLKVTVFPLIVIYSMAGIGSIFGGALSSALIKSGRSIDFSRKAAILICALLALPLIFITKTHHLWIVVIIIGLAVAAHQGWASNILTIVSDIYPRKTIATMTGLSGFAGAIGGAFAASFIGIILQFSQSYLLIFMIASMMYLLAWLLLRILIPQIKQINILK